MSQPVWSDTILRAVALMRMGQGWSAISAWTAVPSNVQGHWLQMLKIEHRLLPPASDPRRNLQTGYQHCKSLGLYLPDYAFDDDPVSTGLLGKLEPSMN